jgi:chromosome segregation ATPase
MLQQIIRSISRAILGRVADSNEKLKKSISEISSNVTTVSNSLDSHERRVGLDLAGKEKRIGDLQNQATAFQNNVENLVRDLESHKTEIWANVNGKEQRIVDNTNGVKSLQTKTTQLSSDLTETNKQVSDLRSNFETKHGELSKAHYDFEAAVKKQYDALIGIIDDENLDSIREIADRITSEAKESQTIRQDMQNADNALHSKIDALLPKELQNKTVAEWEQFIEDIVAQEIASQEAAATR